MYTILMISHQSFVVFIINIDMITVAAVCYVLSKYRLLKSNYWIKIWACFISLTGLANGCADKE
jgi:hypothetical protein